MQNYWIKIVTRLATFNWSDLFQQSKATLHNNLFVKSGSALQCISSVFQMALNIFWANTLRTDEDNKNS